MHLYDYASWKAPPVRRQQYGFGGLLRKDAAHGNFKHLARDREFRAELSRSRSEKNHRLSRQLPHRQYQDYSRKSLLEKLDRKLDSIRNRNLNGSQLKRSTTSLHREQSPFSSPKRYFLSQPTPDDQRLVFGEKRSRLKEEIAKSIGRLSRVSRKLYEQRKDEMHQLRRGKDQYFTRARLQQPGQARIERKLFAREKQSRFGSQREKYSRILKNQQLLEDQLKGFGSYGLYNRSRHRF